MACAAGKRISFSFGLYNHFETHCISRLNCVGLSKLPNTWVEAVSIVPTTKYQSGGTRMTHHMVNRNQATASPPYRSKGTTTTSWGGRPGAGLNHKWPRSTSSLFNSSQHQCQKPQLQPQLETSEQIVFYTNEQVRKFHKEDIIEQW